MSENLTFEIFDKIGGDIVAALEESSYDTPEALAKADDADIKAIKGIGPATVRKIRLIMADAGIGDDPDAALPEPAQGQVKRDHTKIEASEVVVGPVADGTGGNVALRSLKNLVQKWDGDKYNITRGQDISGLPKKLRQHLINRNEAAMRPPFK